MNSELRKKRSFITVSLGCRANGCGKVNIKHLIVFEAKYSAVNDTGSGNVCSEKAGLIKNNELCGLQPTGGKPAASFQFDCATNPRCTRVRVPGGSGDKAGVSHEPPKGKGISNELLWSQRDVSVLSAPACLRLTMFSWQTGGFDLLIINKLKKKFRKVTATAVNK